MRSLNTRLFTAHVLLAAAAAGASAQVGPTMPNELETASVALAPLFSYFGGVDGFGAELSATTIHTGNSLRCWGNFRHDNIFRIAGFAVGTFEISAPALAVPSAADTFSVTVRAPAIPQTMAMVIAIKEDDDADGIIDLGGPDDQWESAPIMMTPGSTTVYNLPFSAFEDADPDSGDNLIDFTTTGTMAFQVTFETRASFPGGIVEVPVSFLIDHVGLYVGAQTIPSGCLADFNGDSAVSPQDIFDFLGAFFANAPSADINGSGAITSQDIFDFLAAFFTPCP